MLPQMMPLPWLYVFYALFITMFSVMTMFNFMPLEASTINKPVKLSSMLILW